MNFPMTSSIQPKRVLLWFVASLSALGILFALAAMAAEPVVPPGFPYPLPIPTSGSTPGTTTRVPGTINRTGYPDNPSMWFPFIGGAQQYFGTTNDMNNFNPKSRVEMQTAWVKDFGYGDTVNGLYMLYGGIDNSNWLLIGSITNGLYVPTGGGGGGTSQNIMNSDLIADATHSQDGNGFNLDFRNFNVWQVYANLNAGLFALSNSTVQADDIVVSADKLHGYLDIRAGSAGTTNSILFNTEAVLNGSAIPGQVLAITSTNGTGAKVEFVNAATGNNIYNSDGTQTDATRVYNGAAGDLVFTNLANISIDSQTTSTLRSGTQSVVIAPDSYVVSSSGSGFLAFNNASAEVRATNGYVLRTPFVGAGTATIGQVLTIVDPDGAAEFLDMTGGTNYINITVTNNNFATTDLTFTGNRTHDADGNSLDIVNLSAFYVNGITSSASFVLNDGGGTAVVDGVNGVILTGNPVRLHAGDYNIRVKNDGIEIETPDSGTGLSGQVLTSDGTNADWADAPNFATTDLTATGNRTHDFDANDLTIQNINNLNLSANGFATIYGTSFLYLNGGDETTVTANGTSYLRVLPHTIRNELDPGDVFELSTSAVTNGTATVGQVLTLQNATTGEAEWADAPAGQNFANADLTFTGTRTHDADGFGLTINNLNTSSFNGTAGFSINDSTSVAFTVPGSGNAVTVDAVGVTVEAPGSNSIKLVTSTINNTATVGQVWTLQNSTTGAGEWADGTSPSGGNVTTVDTISDLLSESTSVVITQGYYSVGDGGHAAYRYVSGDTTLTNTVTVFEGAAGRYFLMQSGSISAKQAGAVADGVTDDHDALQALFDNCSGLTARIDPLNYYSSAGFTKVDDLKVIARGANLTVDLNGETGFPFGSRSTVDGGTWLFAVQSGGANGFDNSGFTFGNYTSAGSVSNSVLKNVHIDLTGYASSAVFITGGSENITVDTVEFPDSSTIDDVVTIHWGFVSGSETNGTLHPHNIKVRNVNVGTLSGSGDASPMFCSAGYDISVDGVTSRGAKHGAIMVVGDYNFKYSGFSSKILGSVVYKNITCLNASNIGVLVQGLGVSAQVYDQAFVLESSTILGPNDGSNNGGLYLNTARNFTARDCVIAGHLQGTTFTGGCKNIVLDRTIFSTNYNQGVFLDDSSTVGVDILECSFYNNARGKSGTNAAGIKLNAGSQVRVAGCKFGNVDSEPNQEVGLGVSAGFVNATVNGNFVYNVKSGGINYGYHLGSSANAPSNIWLFYDNQVASGITLVSAPETLPFQARGKYRDFAGTGTPTLGSYLKGDVIVFNEATSSPFALKCTVAGTTFVTLY